MPPTDREEKEALKANVLELAINRSGIRDTGCFIPELANMIVNNSEEDIRSVVSELNDEYTWVKFQKGAISVSSKKKAQKKIKELRNRAFR